MKKYMIRVNGKSYEVEVEEIKTDLSAGSEPNRSPAAFQPPPSPPPVAFAPSPSPPGAGGSVMAPMPGVILKLNVKPGDAVKQGDVLMTLEAMKMENDISSPRDGKITAVHVSVSASVNAGDPLIDLE